MRLVTGYYQADTLAERVLAYLRSVNGDIPESIYGIDLIVVWDEASSNLTVSFSCPVSERKELGVEVVFHDDGFRIAKWHMQDTVLWEPDDRLPVWQGSNWFGW